MLIKLFIGFLAAGVIGYVLDHPEELKDVNALRLSKFGLYLCNTVGKVGETLGIADFYVGLNKCFDTLSTLQQADHTGLQVEERHIARVRVLQYTPDGATDSMPAVIYFHGGGFIFLSPEFYDGITSRLAKGVQAVVISVDYRLAPRHPYPAGFNDCLAVTKYVLSHGKELGIDTTAVALAGDSAGGNLAASVSLKLRDVGLKQRPKAQLLIYPYLQAFDFKLPSIVRANSGYLFQPIEVATVLHRYLALPLEKKYETAAKFVDNQHTTPAMKKSWASVFDPGFIPIKMRRDHKFPKHDYGDKELSKEFRHLIMDPYIHPLMAKSFKDLPETFVLTAEFDTLRDEGILYVEQLKRNGVKATWYHAPETFHGYFNNLDTLISSQYAHRDIEVIVSFLKNTL